MRLCRSRICSASIEEPALFFLSVAFWLGRPSAEFHSRFVSFDQGASDGALLRLKYTSVVDRPLSAGEEDVLLLRGATVAELPYTATKVVAMDLEGRPFKTLEPEVRNGRTVLRPVDGAVSFRISR